MRSHRLRLVPSIATTLVLTACGGGSPPPPATQDGARDATPPPVAEAAGGETIRLVITGGDDAGTYTSSEDPLCSKDKIGPGGWNVNYMNIDLTGPRDFTALNLAFYTGDPPTEGLNANTQVWAIVKLGELMSPNTREHVFRVSPTMGEGSGSATVEDGPRPVIRATGTTSKGVGLDITVHCIDSDGMP